MRDVDLSAVRPYADHLDETEKTGISRVVSYGVAYFVDGKLAYYPERETVLVKPMADGRTFGIKRSREDEPE